MKYILESMQRCLWAGTLLPALVLGCHAQVPSVATTSGPESTASARPVASPAPQTAAPPFSPGLHFAWPVPGRAGVTARAEKNGHTSTLHYFLVLTRGRVGGEIEVRFEDFTVLDIDGQDLTSPQFRGIAEQLRMFTAVIPTMVISPEGDYTGVRGLDEMNDKILSSNLIEQKDPKKAAATARLMRSPESKAQAESKCGDCWNSWVGQWKGLGFVPGETGTAEEHVRLPGGAFASTPVVFEHHGSAPGEPRLARLSKVAVLEGEAAGAAVIDFMKGIGEGDGLVIEKMRRETRSSTDTDPRTLMPRRVRVEVLLEMKVKDHPVANIRQVDEYEFDWAP